MEITLTRSSDLSQVIMGESPKAKMHVLMICPHGPENRNIAQITCCDTEK